jgi:hypothetical protein
LANDRAEELAENPVYLGIITPAAKAEIVLRDLRRGQKAAPFQSVTRSE